MGKMAGEEAGKTVRGQACLRTRSQKESQAGVKQESDRNICALPLVSPFSLRTPSSRGSEGIKGRGCVQSACKKSSGRVQEQCW